VSAPGKQHPLVDFITDPIGFARDAGGRVWAALDEALPLVVAVIAVVAAVVVAARVARRVRDARLRRHARLVKILVPPEVAPSGAHTLWMGLHAILRPAWRRLLQGQPHVSWEIAAEPDRITFYLWVPAVVPPGLVERAIESSWPGARAEVVGDDEVLPQSTPALATSELVLAEPEWFPIGEAPDDEPLRLVLGCLTALEPGERASVQVVARPATSAARLRLLRAARHLRRQVSQTAVPFWAASAHPGARRPVGYMNDPTVDPDVRAVLAKAASPLWRCSVRVAVSSFQRERARGKIHALAGAFAVFEGRNGFRRRRMTRGGAKIAGRSLGGGFLLSVPELAQVASLPCAAVPGLEQARARTLAPARAVAHQGHILGLSDHIGVPRPVAISVPDSRHHMHLVGETGTGKSTLIARMVLADADAGRAAVVIDPKGDLVETILDRLPHKALARTCLIDPDDANRAVGLNVLAGDNPDLTVDHVVGVFKRIYEPWWGPRTDDIMRAVCLTLTMIPGATLTEIPNLLSHDEWRRAVGNALKTTPGLGGFWSWFEQLGDQQRANIIAPLLNKLRAFLLRGPVRAIVGQATPKLDIDAQINSGGLLLLRIPKGTIGEETSRLLGAFTVARVWQAAMRRAHVPEAERPDTTLYVDEMHNYLALPRSFEDLLAEARGYRLSLVLAHQHMNQLPRDMREALAANARTKVVFACSPEDAAHLERHFEPLLMAHDLHNLGSFQAACRPCVDAGHGTPFTFTTEPLEAPITERAARARKLSGERFGTPRADVEAEIGRRHSNPQRRLLPEKAIRSEQAGVSQGVPEAVSRGVAEGVTS
jgi:hypothetical protein